MYCYAATYLPSVAIFTPAGTKYATLLAYVQ
jgi:hypothetical protein